MGDSHPMRYLLDIKKVMQSKKELLVEIEKKCYSLDWYGHLCRVTLHPEYGSRGGEQEERQGDCGEGEVQGESTKVIGSLRSTHWWFLEHGTNTQALKPMLKGSALPAGESGDLLVGPSEIPSSYHQLCHSLPCKIPCCPRHHSSSHGRQLYLCMLIQAIETELLIWRTLTSIAC